jgi:hypothetical protein
MYAVARIFHQTPLPSRNDILGSTPDVGVDQAKRTMTYKSDNRPTKQRASGAQHDKSRSSLNTGQRTNEPNQWQRRYEHYRNLAQQPGDADSVTREHYWQHAEHFCRLMNGSAT